MPKIEDVVFEPWVVQVLVLAGTHIVTLLLGIHARQLVRVPRMIARRVRGMPRKLKIWGRKGGSAGLSAHPELGGNLTAIERELHMPEEAFEGPEHFDFGTADRELILKAAWGYKKFRKPPASFDNAPDTLSEAATNRYAELAKKFLSNPVILDTDHRNLYDDEEGAVIAKMFKCSDRPILYAVDTFRRVVGDNARLLIHHFFLAVLLAAGGAVVAARFPAMAWAGVGMAGVAFAGSFATYLIYKAARDSGFADFSGLLERYLAGVSDKFFQASSRMVQAVLGEEDDQGALAEKSEKWHKIMLWLGFRTFFIESFLRSEVYQARRNLEYYQLYGFVLLIAIPAAMALVAFGLNPGAFTFENLTHPFAHVPLLLSLAAALVALVSFYFVCRKDADLALSQKDWRGFKALHMEGQLREVIGKYAQEAAIGKRRGVLRPGGVR